MTFSSHGTRPASQRKEEHLMGTVIDLIIVAVYAFIIFLAAKRGFIRTAVDLAGSLLAVFLSFQIAGSVAGWIYNSYLQETVLGLMQEHLPASMSGSSFALNPQEILDALPEYAAAFVSRFDLLPSAETFTSLGNIVSIQTLEQKIVGPIVTSVLKMICFVVLCIVLLILMKILAKFITSLIKHTPLKKFNTLLGAVLGALKGLITMTLICVALIALSSFMSESSFTLGVADSKICNLLSGLFGM